MSCYSILKFQSIFIGHNQLLTLVIIDLLIRSTHFKSFSQRRIFRLDLSFRKISLIIIVNCLYHGVIMTRGHSCVVSFTRVKVFFSPSSLFISLWKERVAGALRPLFPRVISGARFSKVYLDSDSLQGNRGRPICIQMRAHILRHCLSWARHINITPGWLALLCILPGSY